MTVAIDKIFQTLPSQDEPLFEQQLLDATMPEASSQLALENVGYANSEVGVGSSTERSRTTQ
jgi:hypothetical protein